MTAPINRCGNCVDYQKKPKEIEIQKFYGCCVRLKKDVHFNQVCCEWYSRKEIVVTKAGVPSRKCVSCGVGIRVDSITGHCRTCGENQIHTSRIDYLLERIERLEKVHPDSMLPSIPTATYIVPEPEKANFNDIYSEIGKDFSNAINGRNEEARSNTPDFILGESLARMLDTLHRTIAHRDKWYGVKLSPGCSNDERKIEGIILDFLKWKRDNKIEDFANDQFVAQAFSKRI